MFAFSVLLNPLLIEFCTVTPIVLLKNIIAGRICMYSFIGYKVPVNRIPRFHNLLEYVDENGKIIRSVRGVEPNEDILNRLMGAREMGVMREVWVTPALPFLFFMLIGFLSAMTVGDIAYLIVYEIFKHLFL